MTISLRYAARSSVGLVRATNQDSAYAGPRLIALCDGMGGPAGGDIASAVAISHLAPLDVDAHPAGDLLGLLRDAVQDAHTDLISRSAADPELAGLGTTCIAILRSGNKLAMVHVGDSRAYLLRDGELTQVTTDHTFVEYLVATGRLTRDEARQHPQRSVLLKVLGDAEGEVQLDESIREAVPGDRWLLCSDGLSGPVSGQTLADVLSSIPEPEAAANELIALAERAGGPDNITAVVVDIVEDDPTPQTEPQIVGSAAENRERLDATAPLPLTSSPEIASTPAAKAAALRAGLARPEISDAEASLGAEGTSASSPASVKGAGRRLSRAERRAAREAEREAAGRPAASRGKRLWHIILTLLGIGVVAGGLGAGYYWTQTQYYVTSVGDQVAIYQGIPQTVGPLRLSHRIETFDEPAVSDLDERMRQRLEETVAQPSLAEARLYVTITVASHRQNAEPTVEDAPTVSVTPSASASPTQGQ